MPIPSYEKLIFPLLKFSSDGVEHSSTEPIDYLAKEFHLTENERNELLPNGKQTIFYNRVGWALTYLKQAGLVKGTKRGFFTVTERGMNIISEGTKNIDLKFLRQFPEFLEFEKRSSDRMNSERKNGFRINTITPEEQIDEGYQIIQDKLVSELLQNIKNSKPAFFERLVVELLVSMGYGGSINEAGKAIGKTGDEGIDGIIKEDVLGLDQIYIQAKKWNGTIGRPDIQKFAGALQGQRARKGIFITTGTFSNESKEYVHKIETKIVLIDGKQLAEYMIDNNIAVTLERSYMIKKIDMNYFEDIG